MGRFVNPDNSAFQVALNSEIYIDKTGLLKHTNRVINTLQGYICNSRPRRFGKSITANMLAAYYSKGCDSENIFAGLEIGRCSEFKRYLNQFDVIHLDIQWCIEPAGGAEHVVSYISQQTIAELKEVYPKILKEDIRSLPEALSCINEKTGAKFVIIIDEWDVLIRDEKNNRKIQKEYIDFLRGMFKGVEPTKYTALVYLTGILPVKKEKTQSALNNFDEYTMLDAGVWASYIGFTQEEVRNLCDRYDKDFEQVKCWYDGYLLDDIQIYNPKAVVSLMTKGRFKSYWSETGSYKTIVPLINMDFDGLKTAVIEMLSGVAVELDVSSFENDMTSFTCRDDVLTCLVHLGYLAYDQNTEKTFIPNEEIRQELKKATKGNKWNELIAFQEKSLELLDKTLAKEAEAVATQIEQIHNEYASAISYNNENSLSSVLTIAYLSSMQYYFKPIREMPTGRGFADFVYIPKPEYKQEYPALLVELKWNKSAETALQQIKDKKYPESLLPYTGDILLVGINYDKEDKKHTCVIEKMER